jgi:hypothetical protein
MATTPDRVNFLSQKSAGIYAPLSFLLHYSIVHSVDIEWLLSTLFDASLLSLEPPQSAALFCAAPRHGGGCRPSAIIWRKPSRREATIASGQSAQGRACFGDCEA